MGVNESNVAQILTKFTENLKNTEFHSPQNISRSSHNKSSSGSPEIPNEFKINLHPLSSVQSRSRHLHCGCQRCYPADIGRCINVCPWLDMGCNLNQLKVDVEITFKVDVIST